MLVHQNAGTGICGLIDDSRQMFRLRYIPGKVMIHIKNVRTFIQQALQIGTVFVHGNIQRRNAITTACVDFFQQRNIALNAGYQCRLTRLSQTQLQQGTDAIGITIKGIKISHRNHLLKNRNHLL